MEESILNTSLLRVRQKRNSMISSQKPLSYSISGKSTQLLQTVIKTPFHNAEKFGNALPVIVSEALTFTDRNTLVSVNLSDNGYAWLVCGRRLIIWQYRTNPKTFNGTPQKKGTQCFELTLPQSDLAHRAELINVFFIPGSHFPSCLAVSPEGGIRYWPNISHESISLKETLALQGQECDSLNTIGGNVNVCVLTTTTCTVILIHTTMDPRGKHSLQYHSLRNTSGWLGGIGKKVSSLIFGSSSAEHSGETRVVRQLTVKESDDLWNVYLLAGQSLQKWAVDMSLSEKLQISTELGRVIRDAYQCTAWESCGSDPADIDIWLLDMQVCNSNIMILTAAVNMHVSPQIQYALVRFDSKSLDTVTQIEEFLLIKLYGMYQEDNTSEFLSYKLLMNENNVFIHRSRDVTVIQSGNDQDLLDFSAINDTLLGSFMCGNTPLLFSRNYGILAIYPSEQNLQDLNRSMLYTNESDKTLNIVEPLTTQTSNLSLYNLEPQCFSSKNNVKSQLKAAFLYHLRNQFLSCQEIVTELIPSEKDIRNTIDNVIDREVVAISAELLDDMPMGDPRWLTEGTGLGSSLSVQILNQLEDKQQAEGLFLSFLTHSGIWNKLFALTLHNSIFPTVYILAEHSEYIIAAIQLKIFCADYTTLLQDAIDFVVHELYGEPSPRLTTQDVFFREITKIYRIFWGLVEKCAAFCSTSQQISSTAEFIISTNTVIINTLTAVMNFRSNKSTFFTPAESVFHVPFEYLPWTARTGEYSIFDSLLKQKRLTLMYGARVCSVKNLKERLYEQYVSLVDLILDARKSHIESVKNTTSPNVDILLHQYQEDKYRLILPLVEDKEWENATRLAEKYLEFKILIDVCEHSNNDLRSDEYINRFKNENFAQHLFNWYLRPENKGKLLKRCQQSPPDAPLTKLLRAHPQFQWIQHVHERNYQEAANNFLELALKEKEYLNTKADFLSYAKLNALVATNFNFQAEMLLKIDREYDLIDYQEELSEDVLVTFGYDVSNPPVLDPITLANYFVCPENESATEFDFHNALKVTEHVENSDVKNQLILHIWASAILRDDVWNNLPTSDESPLNIIRNTMLFKIVELITILGKKPSEFLPPINTIIEFNELGKLAGDENFIYLMKVAYDYFSNTYD